MTHDDSSGPTLRRARLNSGGSGRCRSIAPARSVAGRGEPAVRTVARTEEHVCSSRDRATPTPLAADGARRDPEAPRLKRSTLVS
jgi:hypothetical protein